MYSLHDPLTRGLPHSDILGSKPARGSPRLYAACHVLHRLLVPRHPPNALLSFNFLLRHEHRTLCDARLRSSTHSTTANSNEIRSLPTMHRNHPSVFWSAILPEKPPLGTAIFQKLNATNHPNKLYPIQVSYPCNVHGHHNRNHCIIIPLNTRISSNYTSRLAPLHRSDNPLPKTRTNSRKCSHTRKNQYAYPDAPKPIHPDKEHFCSTQQFSWEQTSNEPRTPPSQSNDPNPKKLDFPHNIQSHHQNQPGGDGRNRTDDPLLAKQVLYQLSYIPHS